jgi:hypothetical protein
MIRLIEERTGLNPVEQVFCAYCLVALGVGMLMRAL